MNTTLLKSIIDFLRTNEYVSLDDIIWELYEDRQHFEQEMIRLQAQNVEMSNTINTLQQTIQAITNKKDVGE